MKGRIETCAVSRIVGWAVEEGRPAELDVFVNAEHVARIRCDVHRPDLAARGLPADAGFLFVFPRAVSSDDEVSVRFTDGSHVNNSPRKPLRHESFVDYCSALRVSGWAAYDRQPAELDVLVNNENIARIRCDHERADLASQGLPTNAGFDFIFPERIGAADEVSVCFADGMQLNNSPRKPAREHEGVLDICSVSRLAGWAVEDGRPAQLHVFINDACIARIRCDRERPDLAAQGLPKESGFGFLLPRTLGSEDEVAVRFTDGTNLRGSPRRPGLDYAEPPATAQANALSDSAIADAADLLAVGIAPHVVAQARRFNLFACLEIKQTLVQRFGIDRGFDLYRRAVKLPECDRLETRRLASLHEAIPGRFTAFHTIAPAGEPFTIEPPLVIGEGNHFAMHGIARPISLACVADARVRGGSGFIEVGDVALLDYRGEELMRIDEQLEFDPLVFERLADTLSVIAPREEAPTLEIDEAFMLLGPHTKFFGHWIWEYLPKYLAASLSGLLADIPVLIDAVTGGDMPATHRQALELLLPRSVRLIEVAPFTTARVRRLWCTTSQMHMPVLERMNERFRWEYLASPPWRLAAIMREMVRRVEPAMPPGTGDERLFLARRDHQHRKLTNRLVIEAVARARGFRVVYPEDLDFAAQARLLRDARFIVAPEGSACFLAFFARPGTRLCILDHPHTAGLPLLTGPLREIGINATVFTGPYVRVNPEWRHCSDYQIDEAKFARFLNKWLESGWA